MVSGSIQLGVLVVYWLGFQGYCYVEASALFKQKQVNIGIIVLDEEEYDKNHDDDDMSSMSIAFTQDSTARSRYVKPMDDWALMCLWFDTFEFVFLTVVSAWSICLAVERVIEISARA